MRKLKNIFLTAVMLLYMGNSFVHIAMATGGMAMEMGMESERMVMTDEKESMDASHQNMSCCHKESPCVSQYDATKETTRSYSQNYDGAVVLPSNSFATNDQIDIFVEKTEYPPPILTPPNFLTENSSESPLDQYSPEELYAPDF